jgi:hypothetical protein
MLPISPYGTDPPASSREAQGSLNGKNRNIGRFSPPDSPLEICNSVDFIGFSVELKGRFELPTSALRMRISNVAYHQ